jgi:tetratricopeptide (TPR) repeat protein
MGDFENARYDANMALSRQPNNASIYLHTRGLAYLVIRDYDQAIVDFEASLRINPNNADARRDLETARRRGR